MSKKINKLILFGMILILLMIIPASFAQNNDSLTLNEHSSDGSVSISLNDDVLSSSNDYYFDASVNNDGDGSRNNPYKYLTDSRILNNSVIHLAKGEYDFEPLNSHTNISIFGDNSIVKGNGKVLLINENFLLKDITIVNTQIFNQANFTAINVVFSNSTAEGVGMYGNSFGGAIYCPAFHFILKDGEFTDILSDCPNTNCRAYVEDCTFENTHAEYGGAIYAENCILDIKNSNFNNCSSYNFGGAIACIQTQNVEISKSKFNKCYSTNDAGGALYIKESNLIADNLEIGECRATFGGAITTLNVDADLTDIKCHDNVAKWNGGAIYHMYGDFKLTKSILNANSASNGGAIFIDSSSNLTVTGNDFIKNTASDCGGAIFSIFNENITLNNRYSGNSAKQNNDEYVISDLSLNVISGNHAIFKVHPTDVDQLPVRYSLVDDGYVTVVKDQESSGNCWAFTAMAVLESCILKASNVIYDLSEENMKNIAALYSDYGWKNEPNTGGNAMLAGGYLISWLGAVNETDDLTDDRSALSPILNSSVPVQNILYLYRDNYTDNDAIKHALLKYGAVGTRMNMVDDIGFDYFNYDTNSYYYYGDGDSNHGMTIVGWDDNYSRYNFKRTPAGDGAWIARNSWGPDWGVNGNFYVSYYDTVFAKPKEVESIYTFILNETIKFDKNYQYDISKTDYLLNSSSTVWYKNVFTAGGDEFVAAVSTYFRDITNWTVSINVNGEFKYSKSGTSNNGYYTIDLDQLIPLKKGDEFEAVFKITVDGQAGFPISEALENSFNHKFYSPNISYASWDGQNWVDLYDFEFEYTDSENNKYPYVSQVACIKAFAILKPIETSISLDIAHNNANPVNITATVINQYGNLMRCGSVVFNLDGKEVTASISNGKATIAHNFDKNFAHVSATFNAVGYVSSAAEDDVDFSKAKIDFNLDIERTLNNVTLEISSQKKVSAPIIVYVNGKKYDKELIDGKTQLDLKNLANDVYTVNITLPSDSIYESDGLIDSFVVDIKKTNILAKDIVITDEDGMAFNVTLSDQLGKSLSNKPVEFVLDGSTYNAITDSNGIATLPVKLAAGYYPITVNFNGDNDYLKSTANANVKVKTKLFIDLSYNRVVNNVTLIVDLSKNIRDALNIIIDGTPYTVDIASSKNYIYLNNLENGVYNISISLNDDDYVFNKVSSLITVDVRNTQIIADDLFVVENRQNTLDIALLDENGNPVGNRAVKFYLAGNELTRTTSQNGHASIPFTLNNGKYVCDVVFEGDNDYLKSSLKVNINVKKVISVDLDYDILLNNVVLQIISSDIINAPLTVKVNNKIYPVTINNYKNNLYLNNMANGNYKVVVGLDNNPDYHLDNVTSSFVVDARNVKIIASNMVTYYNSGDLFDITLMDDKNNLITQGNVTLKVAGQVVPLQVTTGEISVALNLNVGEFDFDIIYEANEKYFGAKATKKITVKSSIVAEDGLKKTYNSKYAVKFLDKNGNPLKNSPVTFILNGEQLNKNTDDDGYAYADIILKPGSHNLTIINNWNNETVTKTIKVVSRIANNKDLTIYEYSNKVYKVRILDDNGNPVGANEKVTFRIAGKSSTVKTDSKGYASFKINLENKVYTLKVTYKGFSVSNKITVKSKLVTNNAVFKKASSYKFQAKLVDNNGKIVKNKKITFKIKTKTYTANTNSKGIATITIKLKLAVGSYKITTSYGNFKETNTIKIKK